jgi:hypothetical protein
MVRANAAQQDWENRSPHWYWLSDKSGPEIWISAIRINSFEEFFDELG